MASDKKPRLPRGRSGRDYLVVGVPALAVLAAGFLIAFKFVEPPPPDRIVIATGDRSGAYYAFAERYREILAADGVEVVLRETTGSVENIRLLDDAASGVDVGFVQGGTGNAETTPRLTSLASLYYEPIWLFTRATLFGTDRLHSLGGARIAVGPEGSGTRAVAKLLLREVGLGDAPALSPLGGRQAGAALRRGDIDAAFVVAGPGSPMVRDLISDPELDLVSIRLAEAMALRHRFLSLIRAPRGVIDPARVRPAGDMTLLAPTAGLAVRADFHPALVELLLRAAERVHRSGGIFEAPISSTEPRS
jgi:TRAP transporter TAXI family solute receptor